jgi:hypothetical protein
MVIFQIPDAESFIIIVLDSESEMGEFATRSNQNRKRNFSDKRQVGSSEKTNPKSFQALETCPFNTEYIFSRKKG